MNGESLEGLRIERPEAGNVGKFEPFIRCFVVDPEGKINTFEITSNRAVIGRAISCDININNLQINPIHAVVEIDKDLNVLVFDMASKIGTNVNGKQITEAKLIEGDEISIGNYKIHIQISFKAFGHTRTQAYTLPSDVPLIDVDPNLVEPIFDFESCSHKGTVELIFLFGDEVLDVFFLGKQNSFNIGTDKRADYKVQLQSGALVPIVENKNDKIILNIPKEFAGIIRKENHVYDLESYRSKLKTGTYGHSVELGESDFAKITYHDFSIFIQYTYNPPKLISKGTQKEDKFALLALLSAILMMCVLLMFTTFIDGRPSPTVKVDQLEKPLSTIVIQQLKKKVQVRKASVKPIEEPKPKIEPPKPKPPTPPKPKPPEPKPPVPPKPQQQIKLQTPKPVTPRPVPKDAVVGQKEQKAAMATPGTAAAKSGVNTAGRKTPRGGQITPGKSEKPDTGLLDLIAGSGSINKKQGGGGAKDLLSKINTASQMKGSLSPSSGGVGGSLVTGSAGGANISEKGLGQGGLQKFGTGAGGYGTDPNGSAFGTTGGKGSLNVVEYSTEESIVSGSIDPALILRVLEENKDRFSTCYTKELNRGLNQGGKVGVKFVIGPSGAVNSAGITSNSVSSAVGGCVVDVLKRLRFPEPEGGGVVTVDHAFTFRQSGQ